MFDFNLLVLFLAENGSLTMSEEKKKLLFSKKGKVEEKKNS
jgi:hypothetical protein